MESKRAEAITDHNVLLKFCISHIDPISFFYRTQSLSLSLFLRAFFCLRVSPVLTHFQKLCITFHENYFWKLHFICWMFDFGHSIFFFEGLECYCHWFGLDVLIFSKILNLTVLVPYVNHKPLNRVCFYFRSLFFMQIYWWWFRCVHWILVHFQWCQHFALIQLGLAAQIKKMLTTTTTGFILMSLILNTRAKNDLCICLWAT